MRTVIPVRMHFNAQDLWFDPADSGAMKGDHVIVATERGTEFGLVTMDPFDAPEEELDGELKPVLRVATDDDYDKAEELAAMEDEAMPVFRKLVKESGLDIKPVGVEFLFGGEKVVFYFAAEDRVDFRDLVRDLAAEFHQRVDMRQIGVRDEARIAGGYAPCGQELCCVRFGGQFQPVSIRMAKEQDLPLNSSKISGVCGRLMCCLRYEFEAYRDFKQRAPKKNAIIDTPLGKAKIVEFNTPRETLLLRLENGKSFTIALKDMTCSEACCAKAKEQGSPLRPDTVTREALEAIGTAEMAMQLAELDRANGDTYILDMSLLETEKPSHRRKHEPAEKTSEDRTPRKRSQAKEQASKNEQAQKQQAADETAKAGEEQKKEQKRQPRGGGMRPRRSPRSQDAQKPQQQGASQAKKSGDDEPKPRRQNAGRSSAKPQADSPVSTQAQKRTRRHHTVVDSPAPAPDQKTTKPQRPKKTDGVAKQANPQPKPEKQNKPKAPGTKDQRGDQPRTQTRRRRRPGDKGGAEPARTTE